VIRVARATVTIQYDQSAFAGVPTERFIEALEAEGIPTQASYPPLHDLAVFKSGEYRKRLCPEQRGQEHAFLQANFSNTLTAAWETVWLVHRVLLAEEDDLAEIVEAIRKIQRQAKALL
jgi:dTDP-4-amino-4,6-dideoxygalactose transaminase